MPTKAEVEAMATALKRRQQTASITGPAGDEHATIEVMLEVLGRSLDTPTRPLSARDVLRHYSDCLRPAFLALAWRKGRITFDPWRPLDSVVIR